MMKVKDQIRECNYSSCKHESLKDLLLKWDRLRLEWNMQKIFQFDHYKTKKEKREAAQYSKINYKRRVEKVRYYYNIKMKKEKDIKYQGCV